MATDRSINSVADELRNSILVAPKRQRRLLSRTFWEKFGFRSRTKERVDGVKAALATRGIRVVQPLETRLGTEDRAEWIHLATDPVGERPSAPRPPDDWFQEMADMTFETEKEVDVEFVVPLVKRLGYTHDDLALGRRVRMSTGSSHWPKEPDLVAFNGTSRERDAALVVVEAKKARAFEKDAIEQARFYAGNLDAVYYVVTNGDKIRVWENLGAPAEHLEVKGARRRSLAKDWAEFARLINKEAVIRRKIEIKASRGMLSRSHENVEERSRD